MLKRLLVTIVLFGSCATSFAYQLLNEEETVTQQRQIAAYNVEKAKQNFFKKIEDCTEASKKESLLPNDFSSISLNEKEIKTIILYFSAKTMQGCVGDAENKYLMAEMIAREFDVDEYSVKTDPDAYKILVTGAGLSANVVRYTPDYLAIDANKRVKLEKITKLKTVFDLDKSIANLLKK